ncbi:hypothetical protein D3C85_1602680 [compost metagenome]
MGDQLNLGVDGRQALDRRIDLAHADAVGVMDDLALQVGQIDGVEVRQVHFTHTRCRQIQRHRRTETAEADDQYATVLQAQLTVDIDVLQQNLPAVAQQFLIIQHGRRPRLMR